MSIFSILIIVIIIISSVSGNKKKVEQSKKSRSDNDYRSQDVNQMLSKANNYLEGNNNRQTKPVNSTNKVLQSANNRKEQEHNHAYVHKVEPIKDINVGDDAGTTMSQLRNKRDENDKRQNASRAGSAYADRNAAKNGDRNPEVKSNERCVVCTYYGAKNIMPAYSSTKYTCYFCREEL